MAKEMSHGLSLTHLTNKPLLFLLFSRARISLNHGYFLQLFKNQ